jgi:very-short-patch-repair endonuclease
MARTNSGARSALAWRLGRRQHGVVSRRQLLALGYSRDAIEHRLSTGRLHQVTRGVYAVGRPELSPKGRWMAAVLACGDDAVLSHRSAGALYEICEERNEVIEISVRGTSEPRRDGLRVRTRPALSSQEVGTLNRIPITSPVRTMIDLATELPRPRLERAVNEADKREVIDTEVLRDALDERAGEQGVRPLRTLLDRETFVLSDEELERLFRPIAFSSGLPLPKTKEMVNGYEVDFFWPGLGLVVETDGRRYHRTPLAQARDIERDQTHAASGLTPLRFTHHQVRYRPERVRRLLAETAARLNRRG